MRDRWLKKLKLALLLFVAFNVLAFSAILAVQRPFERPYPTAKIKLCVVEGLNWLYALPLGSVLPKLGNPVGRLQDSLFQSAMTDLPAEDGEREVWWMRIYFAQYKAIINPQLQSFLWHPSVWSDQDSYIFEPRLGDLYRHLMRLAQARVYADPEIRNQRLPLYTGAVMLYLRGEQDLYNRRSYNSWYNFRHTVEYQRPYFRNLQELQRVENLLQGYLALKQAILKETPQEYQAFAQSEQYLKEPLLLYQASVMLLAGKILNQEFSCQEPHVRILLESIEALPKLHLLNGERVYSLAEPPKKRSQKDDYTEVYYNLQRMEQAQLVGATLQKQCGHFQGATFQELKKQQDLNDPMQRPNR